MSISFGTLGPITASAGTFVKLSATPIYAASVAIYGGSGNTNNVYIGPSGVTSTNGFPIGTAAVFNVNHDYVIGMNTEFDLSQIFLATDTNGNTVRVFYTVYPARGTG